MLFFSVLKKRTILFRLKNRKPVFLYNKKTSRLIFFLNPGPNSSSNDLQCKEIA